MLAMFAQIQLSVMLVCSHIGRLINSFSNGELEPKQSDWYLKVFCYMFMIIGQQ